MRGIRSCGENKTKRVRAECDCKYAPSCNNLTCSPRLRCPWCGNGFLLRPDAEDMKNNSGVGDANKECGTAVCTNRTTCFFDDVLSQDTSIAFSGISVRKLLCFFYASLDNHLQNCSSCDNGMGYCVDCCVWSIVAERNPLFAVTPGQWPPSPVFYFLVCEECGIRQFVC